MLDLGLCFLKLLVLLSFPVIYYVIRRKWELAVAREVEIRSLMALAAAEVARAEEEAAEVGYYAGGSVNRAEFGLRGEGEVEAAGAEEEAAEAGYYADGIVNGAAFGFRGEGEVEEGSFQFCTEVAAHAEVILKNVEAYKCAVCLSPTKARCSHCKSIWYCSTKCQIFHWWEGHRDTCYPPSSILTQSSNAECYYRPKTSNREKEVPLSDPVETEDRLLNPSCTHLEGNVFCSIGQTEQLNGNNDSISTMVPQEVTPSVSTVSFSTAFSSDSSLSSATSYSSDYASTTGSSSTSDIEKSNGYHHDDTFNLAKSVTQLANEIKPYDSNGSITFPSELKTQLASTQHDNQKTAYSTPIMSTESFDPLVAKSGPPDFWERALDYGWSKPVETKSRAKNDSLSDIRSSLSHASGFHGNIDKSCHLNGKMPGSSSMINEPSNESVSSKKIDLSSSKVGIPVPLNSNIPAHAEDVCNSDLNISGDYKSVSSSAAAILSPTGEESQDDAHKVSISPLLSTQKAGHTISGANNISNHRRSSASNGDGTVKWANACQDYDVSHSLSAKPSSLSAERNGHSLNSYECTKQSLNSKLVGSLPSNSGGKVASHATNINVVTSNNNVATSDKTYPRKVATGLKKSTQKAVDRFQDSKLSRHCRAEKKDDKDAFSYRLFRSLYGWNKIELQPCGLVNCGNSCYANAVLQCLAFTPPLTAYLLEGLHSINCSKRDWCFTCEFEKLILKAKDAKSPIAPNRIISQIQNIGSHLSYGREEDAHEFLRCVVDTMQSICLKEGISKMSSNVEEGTTLLSLTFGGYLQSKIRCLKCGNKSERSERIMDLSVEIEGSIRSLEDALKRFTSSETLDGENKYNCDRCKSYQSARKKLSVLEAPNILAIALKRFQAGAYGKLSKWIEFPQILNMAPYMSGTSDDKAPVYDLYGVIVHLDTMNAAFSGHYVCYVKNIQKKWFKIDDSVVKMSDFGEVKNQSAYMLLYARCLPKAPRYLRDKLIADSNPKATPPLTRHSPGTPGPKSPDFDNLTSIEAYSNWHSEKFETDSYSNNISLSRSCSDKNSGCTDIRTRESNRSDDLSDLIFGDSGYGLRYPWNSSSNSDSYSPSISPL